MFKKTISFNDYDGQKRTEDFYFNISKAELIEMEMVTPGGFRAKLQRIINSPNRQEVWETFKEIITSSYGYKSADGRQFVKSAEATQAFLQTEAYSEMLEEFVTNSTAASGFITAVLPQGAFLPDDGNPPPAIMPVGGNT